MPCRQSRSAAGRGPGDRSGQGGSNGSISAQKSSSRIHGRVLTPSRTAESSQRSRPTRTSQQDRVTSSKAGNKPARAKPTLQPQILSVRPAGAAGGICRSHQGPVVGLGPKERLDGGRSGRACHFAPDPEGPWRGVLERGRAAGRGAGVRGTGVGKPGRDAGAGRHPGDQEGEQVRRGRLPALRDDRRRPQLLRSW